MPINALVAADSRAPHWQWLAPHLSLDVLLQTGLAELMHAATNDVHGCLVHILHAYTTHKLFLESVTA